MTEHRRKAIGTESQALTASQRRFTRLLKNAALLCFGVMLALSLGELLVRYAAPQQLYRFPKGMFVNHPTLQHTLTPDFRGTAKTTEYKTSIRTNSMGLREDREYGPKPTTTYRILAIGDSFTMGVGVESESTFTKILERRLQQFEDDRQYETINSGVPGYNTRQEQTHLKEYGLHLEPDLILLGFFIGNDIADNFRNSPTVVIDGYLRSGTPPEGFLPFFIRDIIERKSHLYNFLWPYQRRLFDANRKKKEILNIQHYLSIYAKEEDQNTSAMWTSTWKQLKLLADLARKHSIEFAVVIIPDKIQINATKWAQIITGEGNATANYDREKPNERLLEYCATLSIPALDLLPMLTHTEGAEQLYLPIDNHWTTRGNTIAAEAIAEFLLGEQLIAPAKVVK